MKNNFKTWSDYINYLDDLAESNPDELIALVEKAEKENKPEELTFCAEAFRSMKDSSKAVPVLMRLLDHPKTYVREGAVYGAIHHMDNSQEIAEKLYDIAETEEFYSIKMTIIEEFLRPKNVDRSRRSFKKYGESK